MVSSRSRSCSRRWVKVKILMRMVQRILVLPSSHSVRPYHGIDDHQEEQPRDHVKEGHFAVVAVECENPERFLVEMRYLTNPAFLKLLQQAEEEYGFQHNGGALTVPCSPQHLQHILHHQ